MDNSIFLANLEYLRAQKQLSLKYIEAEVLGHSVGYLSRYNNSPEKFPTIEDLYRLSSLFNINIDLLVRYPLYNGGANEKILLDFSSKLEHETISGIIKWQKKMDTVRENYTELKCGLFTFKYYVTCILDDGTSISIKSVFEQTGDKVNPFRFVGYMVEFMDANTKDIIRSFSTNEFQEPVQTILNNNYTQINSYVSTEVFVDSNIVSIMNNYINK